MTQLSSITLYLKWSRNFNFSSQSGTRARPPAVSDGKGNFVRTQRHTAKRTIHSRGRCNNLTPSSCPQKSTTGRQEYLVGPFQDVRWFKRGSHEIRLAHQTVRTISTFTRNHREKTRWLEKLRPRFQRSSLWRRLNLKYMAIVQKDSWCH